jgi:hypothetical protein
MRSFTSRRFRDLYASLPAEVQLRAKRAYRLFQDNPNHPGLNFKMVDDRDRIYSVRVGLGHRALGQLDGKDIVWFWIGEHSEYDRLLRG